MVDQGSKCSKLLDTYDILELTLLSNKLEYKMIILTLILFIILFMFPVVSLVAIGIILWWWWNRKRDKAFEDYYNNHVRKEKDVNESE